MTEIIKVPVWFWMVSFVCLTWNLLGVSEFVQHITITPEMLEGKTEEELAMYKNYPMWATVAFALAVFGGTIGCGGLILRKKWSKPILVVSLIGVLLQMVHSLFISGAMEIYGPGAAVMPVMIVIIAGFLVWFAELGIKRGWLL